MYDEHRKSGWPGLLIRKEETVTEMVVFILEERGFRSFPAGEYRVSLEYCTPDSPRWLPIRELRWIADPKALKRGESFTLGLTHGGREVPGGERDKKQILVDV